MLSTSTFQTTFIAPLSSASNGAQSFTTITSVVTGTGSSTTVVPVTSTSAPGGQLAGSSQGSGRGSGLSTGAKAGIGVGAAFVALGSIGFAWWLSMFCRKRRRDSISESDRYPPSPMPPPMAVYSPAKRQPSELSSSPPISPAPKSPMPASAQHAHSWGSGSVSEMYQQPIHEERPAFQTPAMDSQGYWVAPQELPGGGASAPPQGVYRGTEMESPLHLQPSSSRPIVPKGVWPPQH